MYVLIINANNLNTDKKRLVLYDQYYNKDNFANSDSSSSRLKSVAFQIFRVLIVIKDKLGAVKRYYNVKFIYIYTVCVYICM